MFAQPEADRLVQEAAAALGGGRLAQAATLLDAATRADPRHPMALTKQAELALLNKDHTRALRLTDAALAIEPHCAPAWYQRASACWSAGRRTEAVAAAARAVDIQPPNPEFRLRLAQFAAWSGRGAEAAAALEPLLDADRQDPAHHAAAVGMMGELAIAEGRFGAAGTFLDRALALHPGLSVTRMMRGMNRLRLGEFRAGWVDYAAREGIAALYPDGTPRLADRAWQGEALAGKTIVVLDDQGNGDAIQFFRYVPLLRDLGAAHVTWRTFSPLVRLLSDTAPYATVVNALPEGAQAGVRFDFQCNSTSLPRWFGTDLDTIPATVPYLRAPGRLKSAIRLPGGHRLKVGLVWSGDTRHTRDHLRSVPAAQFLTLADEARANRPGVRFHSLQHVVRTADLPALEARPGIGRAVEAAVDFADTAALIARLDLVITVDTAIAHLAGAMGKPVWIVLHVSPDWRWLVGREDSPWYPTARLFRVTPAEWLGGGDAGWGPVLNRVSAALAIWDSGERRFGQAAGTKG